MRTKRWIELGAAAALLAAVAAAVGGYLYVQTLGDRLATAARAGDAAAVKVLLSRGAGPNTVRERHGWKESVLRSAARRGHLEVVRLLLDRGAEVDGRDRMGATTLWWVAATEGRLPIHARIAALLLQRGADPNAGAERRGHDSVLARASTKGNPELVAVLLKHGARPYQTASGATEVQAAEKAAAIRHATRERFRGAGPPLEPLLERELRAQQEVVRLLRAASRHTAAGHAAAAGR